MVNLVVGAVLLMVLLPPVRYIVKEKKKGSTCIGCPNSGKCGKGNCHCHG